MERRQKKNGKEGKEEESQREENKNRGKEIERDKEGERWAGGGVRGRDGSADTENSAGGLGEQARSNRKGRSGGRS